MGNNACCSDTRGPEGQSQTVQIDQNPLPSQSNKTSQMPPLSPQAQIVFQDKRPFQKELETVQNAKVQRIGQEIYRGEVDENGEPSGWGKFFKKNGGIYVGNFLKGRAEGPGACVLADGSYYEGEMVNNVAETTCGHFQNATFTYTGGFHLNDFHGHGCEKGHNYEFTGQFQAGKRKFGTLKWQEGADKYVYVEGFDLNGKFTGKGKLQDPFGEYEGHFNDGLKEGFGSFQFKTGIRYEGYYKAGVKNGRGSIINADGTIAFCGQFLNGLPHGKGFATDKKGIKHSLEWNQGIYADLL